jgi:solute carrier family 25 thiamine pyrophosphate transporter 19
MQLQTHSVHVKNNKQPIKYLSILQTLKTIMKEEGIRVKYIQKKSILINNSKKGLYKGNMPAEYLYLSYTMIEFWSYKELEQLIESNQKQIPETLKSFGCGMIAGSIATASTYPFDLLRTQFAVAQKVHKTTLFDNNRWVLNNEI